MSVDLIDLDQTRQKFLPKEELDELLACARRKLQLGSDRPWRLLSARAKLRKILFEVEESSPQGSRLLIGKVSRSDRCRGAFQALATVWQAGFRPPSLYTVVRPIAYLEKEKLLIQEKAAGVQLLEFIRKQDESAAEMACRAARWLSALHSAPITALPFDGECSVVERCKDELCRELPQMRESIISIANSLIDGFAARRFIDVVPSHGDFHPLNVFLAEDGRVTVIDFDTFSARERAFDVAYFLSQCIIMGYLSSGSLEATSVVRGAFLNEYQRVARCKLDTHSLGLYIAFAFLQSLHFERCILHTGKTSIVEPWLASAKRCLDGEIDL